MHESSRCLHRVWPTDFWKVNPGRPYPCSCSASGLILVVRGVAVVAVSPVAAETAAATRAVAVKSILLADCESRLATGSLTSSVLS